MMRARLGNGYEKTCKHDIFQWDDGSLPVLLTRALGGELDFFWELPCHDMKLA